MYRIKIKNNVIQMFNLIKQQTTVAEQLLQQDIKEEYKTTLKNILNYSHQLLQEIKKFIKIDIKYTTTSAKFKQKHILVNSLNKRITSIVANIASINLHYLLQKDKKEKDKEQK